MSTTNEMFSKTMVEAFNPENMKHFQKGIADNLSRASELYGEIVRWEIDAGGKFHDFWRESLEACLKSQQQMTTMLTEKLNGK
jgi:hypothetical protein